jgi:hypothetical protein
VSQADRQRDARALFAEAGRQRDAKARQELAVALLLTVEPSDRALAGWGIEPRQLRATAGVAMRPPSSVDSSDGSDA